MQQKKKRILLTTADETTWVYDKPVLFLGKWCLNPHRKHIWSKLDYKVFDSNFFSYENKMQNIKYSDEIYEKILPELAKTLNKIHSISWSRRSWEIFVGPWLRRFIGIINIKFSLFK